MIKRNSDFRWRFGSIGYLEPGDGLAYFPIDTDEAYRFPDSMSEAEVEELMERCVKENKDLIIDLVKDTPVVYKPGCLY